VTSFDTNLIAANDIWSLYDKIIEVGQAELETRTRVQADTERALDESRKSQAELAGLNDAIASLNALGQQLASAATSEQSAHEVSAQNLDIAKQLLRTADLDNSSMASTWIVPSSR
jgi:beta-phosphoglucomutase-like phosphatase (HAD superfamily)